MAAMTSKFYYVYVIQYYSDQWARGARNLTGTGGGERRQCQKLLKAINFWMNYNVFHMIKVSKSMV